MKEHTTECAIPSVARTFWH